MPALCHDCSRAYKRGARSNKFEMALVCALFSLVGVARAQPATAPSRTSIATPSAAQIAIERGQELFDTENYAGALSEFEAAYHLLEGDSKRAAMLSNIALCHERMFRYDLALTYYEKYLHEAGPEARGRAAAETARKRLRDLLVT